jgi:hypothetical protein
VVNVAGSRYGARVQADTEYSPEHGAANVADGRMVPGAGSWFSRDWTKLPCALTFALSGDVDVRTVVLYQAAWVANMYHTREFAVEASQNGSDWQRVAVGVLPDESLARREVPFSGLTTRFLRIVVLSSYNPQQTCGFAEVEIMAAGLPGFGRPSFELNGRPALPATSSYCGLSLIGGRDGPQVLVTDSPPGFLAAVRSGETVRASVEVHNAAAATAVVAEAALAEGSRAEVILAAEGGPPVRQVLSTGRAQLRLPLLGRGEQVRLQLDTVAAGGEAAVRWSGLRLVAESGSATREFLIPAGPLPRDEPRTGPPSQPELRPPVERALIEWDWRLQDGIATPRVPSTYADAIERMLRRGDDLLQDLRESGVRLEAETRAWSRLRSQKSTRFSCNNLSSSPTRFNFRGARISLRPG